MYGVLPNGMLDFPSWVTDQQNWQPMLANIGLPGAVHLVGVKLANQVKPNKKPGESGGTVITIGLLPPKFTFECKIFTATDENALYSALPIWISFANPQLGGQLEATVYHPLLSAIGIVSCFVESIHFKSPDPGGILTVEIECVSIINGVPLQNELVKPGQGPKTRSASQKSVEQGLKNFFDQQKQNYTPSKTANIFATPPKLNFTPANGP